MIHVSHNCDHGWPWQAFNDGTLFRTRSLGNVFRRLPFEADHVGFRSEESAPSRVASSASSV